MPTQYLNIILYIFVIIFALIGMCISILVLLKMFYYRLIIKKHPIDYLLFANSYFALLFVFPFFFDMCIFSIYGYLQFKITFNEFWCRFKAYIMYLNGYVYFYSFLLQAIYRFCRIIYYKQTQYQSFCFYIITSILIWFNGIWQMLPSFILHHIDYIPNEFHCQLPLTYLSGSLIGLSIMFLITYILTLSFYIYTICYIHRRTVQLKGINQRFCIRRDLIIFKRVTILFTLVTLVAMPHVIIPIMYAIFGYLPSWICPFEWLTTMIALAGVAIFQITMFPSLRKLFFR